MKLATYLLLGALALPATAEQMQPGVQVWTRIVARNHNSGCCALEGNLALFQNDKLIRDWELERDQFAAWTDGEPVRFTVVSDTDGVPDVTFEVIMLDKDTMVLYDRWFPNRNKTYKRVK